MLWAKPIRELWSIPGYIDDGASWATVVQAVFAAMTIIDVFLVSAGAACLLYAWWPQNWLKATVAHPDTLSSEVPADKHRQPATVRKTDAESDLDVSSTSKPPHATATRPDSRWIAEAEALVMIRASSLVRLRLPLDTTTVGEMLTAQLQGRLVTSRMEVGRRADEIARHLLRKFKDERSWGVRGGTYDRRLLEEWIDEMAYSSGKTP